jgi:hypothetical protein
VGACHRVVSLGERYVSAQWRKATVALDHFPIHAGVLSVCWRRQILTENPRGGAGAWRLMSPAGYGVTQRESQGPWPGMPAMGPNVFDDQRAMRWTGQARAC